MSGQQPAPCITGVTLTDPTLCPIINEASTTPLSGPDVTAPTPVQTDILPAALKTAILTESPLISYNFETSATPIRAERAQYTVDTYTNSIQNSAVLVKKPPKTTGTLSGVTGPDSTTGKYTATVTYTVNGTSYTFSGSWDKTVANDETVDVYYKPSDVSHGSLTIEGTGVIPPDMASTPGYELIDFQSAVTAGNLLASPTVTNVDECANQCDDTAGCAGFNFGALDTSTVCELVRSTTNREYVDNKVGFVKENVPTAQTGNGSNRPGTDLTNQGAYCEDAPACNRDIARVINENSSATDPIASFSTSDLSSCAYCPIRKYNRAGHVTTNEVGVSKRNASPADAITQLQYQADGTFASHLTLGAGKCYEFTTYDFANWTQTQYNTPNNTISFSACLIPTSDNNFKILVLSSTGMYIYNKTIKYVLSSLTNSGTPNFTTQTSHRIPPSVFREETPEYLFKFEPINYVENGFRIIMNGIAQDLESSRTQTIFKNLTAETYSSDFNKSIFVVREITIDQFYTSFLQCNTRGWKVNSYNVNTVPYSSVPLFLNASNELFYVTVQDGKFLVRKVPYTMRDWYFDANPSWGSINGPYVSAAMFTPENPDYDTVGANAQPLNMIKDSDFWTSMTTRGSDMPEDPYETFGQYRTVDHAPPPAAQTWAYNRRKGCNQNCGSVPNGYAIYKCTASGGGNCDPGKGAYVSGAVCSGTHISCRPTDNSTDMKTIFSYQFAGLRVVSSIAISGGSNSDHNTDGLRIRTIYERDTTQTVTTDITKISTLFRPITQQRLAAIGLVQPTVCAPGLYVAGTSPNKYCAVCPGNPQPTATQVWRPDPSNPGATLCTFDECPQGKTPDALHGTCRALCSPGTTTTAGGSCSTCPRMQYPWWSVSSARSGPGSYWPDAPIPSNVIWKPNSIVPGTYLCEFMQCEGSLWAVDNNTRCGGVCARGTELNTATNSCRACTVPSNVRIDQTWDSEMINTPDGSGQVATYKCTMTQCPAGFFTYNYTYRYCQACGDDTTTSFTFNATGFHTQYGYTPPAGVLAGTGVGDWTLEQKRAFCTFVACKPGYQNYVASSRSCTQSCPTTPGFTTTFSSGCTVSGCTVNPGGGILTGGLSASSGRCEATACRPGYALSGGGCVACTAPQGATVVYDPSPSNQTCRVTSCTLTGKGPANVKAYEVVDGQCSTVCSDGYYKNASDVCTACSGFGAVSDPGTVPVYTKNTCQIASCGVNATLAGKATATVESVQGYGSPPPQYCKTSAAAGYYKLLNGTIFQCPAGDPGTQYTYRTSADGNCDLATCSLTTTSDPNEIAYKIPSTNGQLKCSKVCRSGYKRNASDSNRCSSQCTGATTDPGITVTYGPYECQIASCTSSTGFPASALDNLTCQVVCPQGSQEVVDPQGRKTCTVCSTDRNIAPWSYSYAIVTGGQTGGSCTIAYGGCQAWDPAAVNVTQSGSTCTATCKTGYVRDSTGFCRPCPNETPTSSSVVTNGVCVSTCKTGHLPNNPSEFYLPVCQKCAPGYQWSPAYKKCMNCSATETTSTSAAGISCSITCRQNYYYNSTTGICTICPARPAGIDDPGVRLDGYDDITDRCRYRHFVEAWWAGQTSYNSPWCQILSMTDAGKNVDGTVLNWSATDPTTMACTSVCKTGYTKTSVTRLCDQCAVDYRWDGTACVTCGTNATTPAGPASGVARAACVCKTGYTGSTCMTCDTNYTWNGSACVACQNGSTIVSGPASGPARSCVCPQNTWGSTCTACAQPVVGQQYVFATCTPTSNTDIRNVLQCGAYNGVPQYRANYVAGNSTMTGYQGDCIPCQVPPPIWNNPNFVYISTACGPTSDSALTTPTACQAWEYRSDFDDGTQGRPANPGTCQACSRPGTNEWVSQVCGPSTNTRIYNISNLPSDVRACTATEYRSGFNAGDYNQVATWGTCQPCSRPGTNDWVAQVCGPSTNTVIYNISNLPSGVRACTATEYRSGFNAGDYNQVATWGTCQPCSNPDLGQYVTRDCTKFSNTEFAGIPLPTAWEGDNGTGRSTQFIGKTSVSALGLVNDHIWTIDIPSGVNVSIHENGVGLGTGNVAYLMPGRWIPDSYWRSRVSGLRAWFTPFNPPNYKDYTGIVNRSVPSDSPYVLTAYNRLSQSECENRCDYTNGCVAYVSENSGWQNCYLLNTSLAPTTNNTGFTMRYRNTIVSGVNKCHIFTQRAMQGWNATWGWSFDRYKWRGSTAYDLASPDPNNYCSYD